MTMHVGLRVVLQWVKVIHSSSLARLTDLLWGKATLRLLIYRYMINFQHKLGTGKVSIFWSWQQFGYLRCLSIISMNVQYSSTLDLWINRRPSFMCHLNECDTPFFGDVLTRSPKTLAALMLQSSRNEVNHIFINTVEFRYRAVQFYTALPQHDNGWDRTLIDGLVQGWDIHC